jgi:hypothetical protein
MHKLNLTEGHYYSGASACSVLKFGIGLAGWIQGQDAHAIRTRLVMGFDEGGELRSSPHVFHLRSLALR